MINYYASKNNKELVGFRHAVLSPSPRSGGLYCPLNFPTIAIKQIENKTFQDTAFHLAERWIGEEIDTKDLEQICYKAFDFQIPLTALNPKLSVLELYHGPSLAFKDVGVRFLAQLLSYFLKKETRRCTLLTATSGDTGAAVASAFHSTPNIEALILYPKDRITNYQIEQINKWGDNIKGIEIEGSFDDCQRLVKTALSDSSLNNTHFFCSANSINIARIIAQTFYYFHAYKQLQNLSPFNVIVPSGNLGNLCSAIYAQKTGLPINKIIAAHNANAPLVKYLATGEYETNQSIKTKSSAMDVGNPSNIERIQQFFAENHKVASENIVAYSLTDKACTKTMERFSEEYSRQIDPHTAVGLTCYHKVEDKIKSDQTVVLSTAHPDKFNAKDQSLNPSEATKKLSSEYRQFKEYIASKKPL